MLSKIRNNKGFTLAELMIAVAVIGTLSSMAVPNFMTYRDKAKVADGVATAETIRGAITIYTVDSRSNLFPASNDITDWDSLVAVCKFNGVTLKETSAKQGISLVTYDSLDSDGDGIDGDYNFIFAVNGVPDAFLGKIIEVSPSGILKRTNV